MKREIPTDETIYKKLVQQVSLRLQASMDWYRDHRRQWHEDYETWHRFPSRPDSISDEDDYDIKLGYAFGLAEQTNAKIVEPMFQLGVPFAVHPTELGDQAAADAFADMCRDYYAKPHVQSGKRLSKKEMTICGPRVEIYEWLNVRVPGKKWGEVDVEVVDEATGAKGPAKVMGEVPTEITLHYGFNTRYPRIFDFYPEPDRTTIDTGQKTDVSWYIEDQRDLALEDMMREMIYDPSLRKDVPRYDFSKLLAAKGDRAVARYKDFYKTGVPAEDGYGPLIVPVHDWTDARGKWNTSGMSDRSNDAVANESFEDRDKVWVCQMRTMNEIRTIANGQFIIERILDPWHRPRLGIAVENYTTDPRCLFGPGLIRPVQPELRALDITKSLEMQNFFRIVNKMMVVLPEKVVTMDDFDPRAGGIVRASPEVEDARTVAYPIQQQNAVSESLATESNLKGDIEFVSSTLDGSPGVKGTRQNHKTASGMSQIMSVIGTRFGVMAAQALITETISGENMLYMTEQFMWDKVSYRSIRDDGTTVFKKFDRTDILTEGRGLRLLVSVDPLWGNTQAQQEIAISLLEKAIEYEKFRAEAKDPRMKRCDVSILFEDVLKKAGRRDLSKIFVKASGEMDPDQEMEILAQGGEVSCVGDLIEHAKTHLLQANSPALAKAIESGKADPKTKTRLLMLVQEDMAKIKTFAADPMGAAQKKLSGAGMVHPGPEVA